MLQKLRQEDSELKANLGYERIPVSKFITDCSKNARKEDKRMT